MSNYLIIASEDPYENRRAERMRDLATSLARRGGKVSVYLAQNAVFGARRASRGRHCSTLLTESVDVLADEFSLRERGIGSDQLAEGVRPAALDIVIDQLAEGRKVLWH